ncbi:MAG: aminoglycoside phosphotransferase family protein [Planctomycetes bacterium]|nr:aminoglycoside phosphotransferase family protein [Planctomycetota bacterium]
MLSEHVLQQFAAQVGQPELARRPWYMLTGKAGPNAVAKIVVPPLGGAAGYVLTVARDAATPVIEREVRTLRRLAEVLPDALRGTVPPPAHHGKCAELPYFAVPFFKQGAMGRVRRRLYRSRRRAFVARWLTELARATKGDPLSREWVESEYRPPLEALEADPRIADETKRTVRAHYELVYARCGEVPSVCCHGDLWEGNLMWQAGCRTAVVLDWGAARWPGLPGADLCRYLVNNRVEKGHAAAAAGRYCAAVGLDPALLPALYDLYNLFVRTELAHAHQHEPLGRFDPYVRGVPSTSLEFDAQASAGPPKHVGRSQ